MQISPVRDAVSQPLAVPVAPETLRYVPIEHYVHMLETSNAQLGAWWTALGVAVGVLTLLLAAVAVIVTVLVWRQSRDFRDQAAEQVSSYREIVVRAVAEHQDTLDRFKESTASELKDEMDAAIERMEQKAAADAGEQKKVREQDLSELKKLRQNLESPLIPPPSRVPKSFSNLGLTNIGKALADQTSALTKLEQLSRALGSEISPVRSTTSQDMRRCFKCSAELPNPTGLFEMPTCPFCGTVNE